MPPSPLVMYLYGERDPAVAALLREQGFQRLVGELFRAEEPAIPSGPPSVWEDAVRLDLLASGASPSPSSYRAGRRLVLIPAAAERGVADLLRPALARYEEIAGAAGAELRAAYGRTAAAERFAWPQVSHSLLAGLFLDLAVGRDAFRSGRISRRATGDSVIWAFQGVSAENAYGVSVIPAGRPQAVFAELWHRRARPTEPRLSASLVKVLAAIARGEAAGSHPRELLALKHLKLVRTVAGSLQPQIPAFGAADTARLRGPLEEGARRLVTGATDPALSFWRAIPGGASASGPRPTAMWRSA